MAGRSEDKKVRDESRALEDCGAEEDGRLFSPSAARNREVILEALAPSLTSATRVLEIGSGTGEHAAHIASVLPHIFWQPSEPDARSRESIGAWRVALCLENMASPFDLLTTEPGWTNKVRVEMDPPPNVIVCINLVHIAPWTACEGLFHGAGELLAPGGLLYFYGPFGTGPETAPSNRAFDRDLRMRNPEWGLREVEQVKTCAVANGFRFQKKVEMPANNLSLFFVRTESN